MRLLLTRTVMISLAWIATISKSGDRQRQHVEAFSLHGVKIPNLNHRVHSNGGVSSSYTNRYSRLEGQCRYSRVQGRHHSLRLSALAHKEESDDVSSSAASSEPFTPADDEFKVQKENKKSSRAKLTTVLGKFSKKVNVDNLLHVANTIPPPLQMLALLSFYVVHLTVLTQHSIIFPFQLIPNQQGRFQSIGLDSLAGIISFATIQLLRNRQLKKYHPHKPQNITIPSLLSSPPKHHGQNQVGSSENSHRQTSSPWNFPTYAKFNALSPRLTSMTSLFLLVSAYFMTGRLAHWVELNLYTLAGLGLPLTIAMHRSLVVLGGHLAWVMIGSAILGIVLRPQPFFGGGNKQLLQESSEVKVNGSGETVNGDANHKQDEVHGERTMLQKYKWYTNRWNENWLWWTIGGYFISSWFFNIADFLNQMILPPHVFELAGEGVVSQLINPENNDLLASLVGYIAPCISAPWWEEVLYRGFLLPALCLQMKFWPAVFVSGIVFSIHHVSTTGAIPLAILGWTWAAIYAKSGNLFVTIMIHAMWNSRVFLGSWLGL